MAVAQTRAKRHVWVSSIPTHWVGCGRNQINTWELHPRLLHGSSRVCARCSAIRRIGSGDDKIGTFRGNCPAWVDTPPEPAWREARGQVGTAADAKAQSEV